MAQQHEKRTRAFDVFHRRRSSPDPGTKVNTERSGSDIRGYERQISNSTGARFHDWWNLLHEVSYGHTHTHTQVAMYIYMCVCREEEEDTFRRNGVKGQGTHRVGSINSSRSGSRRRPTFLSGHRSSRVPRILLTFCLLSSPPFPVFVIDDLGVDLRRDE